MYATGKLLHKSVELGEESVSIGKKMLEKQDDTIGKIEGLRQDRKSFMEERFDRLEHEIELIKAKRNQPASFDSSPRPLLPPLRLSQLPSFLLVLLQLQL